MESFTIQLTNGLLVGTTIALTALGLSLVFGILHIVNLAHGEFYMTGAYLCWAFNAWLGNFWLAVPLATVCTALLGSAVLMMFFRRMLGSGPLRWALLTLGFGYVLREVAQHVFGIDFKLVDLPVEGTLPFLGGALVRMRTVCSECDHILQLNAASGGLCKDGFTVIVRACGSLLRELQA